MAWVIEDRNGRFYTPGSAPVANPRMAKVYADKARAQWTEKKLGQIDPLRSWHVRGLGEAVLQYEEMVDDSLST